SADCRGGPALTAVWGAGLMPGVCVRSPGSAIGAPETGVVERPSRSLDEREARGKRLAEDPPLVGGLERGHFAHHPHPARRRAVRLEPPRDGLAHLFREVALAVSAHASE